MKSFELQRWMKLNDKTVVDVASATKVHPQTVQRFLKGLTTRPSTREAFRRLVFESLSANNIGGFKAIGS